MTTDSDWIPDGVTIDAIDGDRDASVRMFERAARGEFDEDVCAWMRHVAEGVLDAQSKDAGRLRDSAIVRALGLDGKVDKHRELRIAIQTLRGFGDKGLDLVAFARTGRPPEGTFIFGHFDPSPYKDMDEDELLKLIYRETQKPS